jgi:hypothetical protein
MLRIQLRELANTGTVPKALINTKRKTMCKKICVLVAMARLAIILVAAAQAQNSAAQGLGATTVGVMNTAPSTTILMAVSSAAAGTAGDKSGMKGRSELVTSSSSGRAVPCTYANSQAYGACPAELADLQIMTSPRVEAVSDHSATIKWKTNIPASAWLRYGTEPNDLNRTAIEVVGDGLIHKVTLSNLRAGTTYFYQAASSAAGTDAITFLHVFSTRGKFVGYNTKPSTGSISQ